MDKDVARLVARLREEIAAFDPHHDPARIGIKQSHAEALYAISMALRHGYLDLARARSTGDEARELALCIAILGAVESKKGAATGTWLGDVFFGSAFLRVAAAGHGTLRHHYLSLFGEGFCRSRERLEEQALQDGLISAGDRRLLAAIREDAGAYKHDHGLPDARPVTSLNDLAVALRVVVGVAKRFAEPTRADAARG